MANTVLGASDAFPLPGSGAARQGQSSDGVLAEPADCLFAGLFHRAADLPGRDQLLDRGELPRRAGLLVRQLRRCRPAPVRKSNYAIAILQSLYVASTTAVLAVALCGSFVLALVFTLPQRLHRLALLLAIAPFWTSYILRVFAWQILLAKRGIINSAFAAMGLDVQLGVLNTQIATRIGLLHYMAPIIIVILFITVKSIDRDLIEAARNLGATRWLCSAASSCR